ncbi:hypothetical protein EB796_019114 [Bugula neritina]|uniref:Uncharacterized protein n=1 Tax=Bugula neritina TaxID=10212 RepID=A0A7J7JAC7_BUGNE|nr:hypothetical protein EB796_019114 [Bugula neritina]
MSLSKIHSNSDDSVLSQLDLFSTPFTQTSVLSGEWVEVGPIRDSANGPLEFEIEGNEDQYLDLQNSLIQVKAKVKLANGDNLDDDIANVTVFPGENFLHSLFSTMSISLNGHEVEYESNYGYRAYLETLVNYGNQAKSTHLNASYWFPDDLNAKDTNEIVESHRNELNVRKNVISGSKAIDMIFDLQTIVSLYDLKKNEVYWFTSKRMACINEAEYALCSVEDREYFKGKVLFPYAIIDEVGMASHFIITDPRRDKLARFIFISSQRTENDPPATINISGIEKLHLKIIMTIKIRQAKD